MKQAAHCSGISSERYWSMTLAEIREEIEAFNRMHKNQMQEAAALIYGAAALIRVAVHEPKHFPHSAKTAFPGLFETPSVTDWHIVKANMSAIAQAHNQKLKGGPNR